MPPGQTELPTLGWAWTSQARRPIINTMDAWWAASLRFVVQVEGLGATDFNDCGYLVRSPDEDWNAAKLAAVSVGRRAERDYLNGDGKRVTWRIERVLTLDYLGPDIGDGREVYSTFLDPDREYVLDEAFDPENSSPGQTGVRPEPREAD